MGQLLTFNPARRPTVEKALTHPYLEQYYEPADEPVADEPFTFQAEMDELPKETLKRMIWDTIVRFSTRKRA
jgi:mitogen-activated protein kinase 1/3